jgi:hypothetical protein
MRDQQRRLDRSEPQRGADGQHRGSSRVHGLDDLAAVDALRVQGRDAEVAVAELALDDNQRRRRTPSTSAIEQKLGHGPSSGS